MGVEPVAVLPFDPALFGQAANNGQMLIEAAAQGGRLRKRCAGWRASLTGRTPRRASGQEPTSLFSFLKSQETGVRAMFGKRTSSEPVFRAARAPGRARRKRRRASRPRRAAAAARRQASAPQAGASRRPSRRRAS